MTTQGSAPAHVGPTALSLIRTVTVGSGVRPDLLTHRHTSTVALAGSGIAAPTAGGDFHPALRTCCCCVCTHRSDEDPVTATTVRQVGS